MVQIAVLGRDETVACWAAMVAFVEDVHAPQYNLNEQQWQAAERVAGAIPDPPPSAEDRMLATALAVMTDEIDTPDLPDEDWAVADRLLADLTAALER